MVDHKTHCAIFRAKCFKKNYLKKYKAPPLAPKLQIALGLASVSERIHHSPRKKKRENRISL
jgi:hypothetical protein